MLIRKNDMKKLIIVVALLLVGCSPPTPLTDEQVRLAMALCDKHGLVASVFNSAAASRVDCVKP